MNDVPDVSERRGYIGGSDASAILGLSPFASPFACFAQKIGIEVPQAIDNVRREKFEFGHAMEPVIAAAFSRRTGIEAIRSPSGFYRAKDHPHMGGHIDFLLPSLGTFLECKNIEFRSDEWGEPLGADRRSNEDDSGSVPLYYLTQCDHYMYVMGAQFCYLAALFGGCRLAIYYIARHQEREALIVQAESRFWQRVLGDDPPEFDSLDDLTLALRSRYAQSVTSREAKATKAVIQLEGEVLETLSKIRDIRTRKSADRKAERDLIDKLLVQIGGKTGYLQVGSEKWGSLLMQDRTWLDDFALQLEAPELVAKHTHTKRIGPILRLTGLSDEV